jgi:hypothetical protein
MELKTNKNMNMNIDMNMGIDMESTEHGYRYAQSAWT